MSASDLFSTFVSMSGGIMDPQGPSARGNAQILVNALGIMLVIVLPTILTTLAIAWWFRATNKKATYLPNWAHSGHIELIIWGIPLLVVLFLSGVIWIGSHDLDPNQPLAGEAPPIEVQVVSLDWKWLFIYPEQGIASLNDLVLPAGKPVHFSLTSGTVMNMFFVPQLGSMIATMNGMVTHLHLQADHTGDYYGQSAQFSGAGFSDMNFMLHAVSQDEFSRWVSRTRLMSSGLDETAYSQLARKMEAAKPAYYGFVAHDLFNKISTRQLMVESAH